MIRRNTLVAQVQRPLRGCYRIALLSLKGGVGKTTITATLGATFASIRGDRVVAVDANPDRGTLSQKVPLETPSTVRHLLRDAEGIEAYSDVRAYTSQGPSRLEVLASESDPAVSEAFSSEDYTRTLEVLERFYSLVLTDCGTGMLHSAMSAVLDKADVLVVISSGSVDGARSAAATLDWLDAHGHQDMVRNSIAVINAVRPRSGKVDLKKVVDHFARRCRAVRQVPFDPHLEEGAEISLDRLKPETREALLESCGRGRRGLFGRTRARRRLASLVGPLRTGFIAPRGRAVAGNPDRRPGRSRASSAGSRSAASAASRRRPRPARTSMRSKYATEKTSFIRIYARVGRLGPCLRVGPDPASWSTCWSTSWPACCSSLC